jgi:hypothetical protein
MSIFKKLGSSLLAVLVSSYAYADVIELDALNADVCRQQILKSTDDAPVIAIYSSTWNEGSIEFIKNIEQLAKTNPKRTFFTWDASEDKMHTTQALCLQQLGLLIYPSMQLLIVDKQERMFLGVRMEYAQFMSIADMEKAIIVPDCGAEQIISSYKDSH